MAFIIQTPKMHHPGDHNDLKEAIEEIKSRYPEANLYGMGISIGANYILKYAGIEGENCKLKAIVSIANPYNLYVYQLYKKKLNSIAVSR